MTLPVSPNSISLSQVNTELGLSSTAQISLNDSAVRTLFGKASGAISMSDGHGKANQFAFTISSNQTNANLRTLAINAGWNQTSKVVATINSGIYVSSSSTGTPALTINGSFPGGLELTNNGFIIGMGGAGGKGGNYNYDGSAGGAGGTALSVSSGVSITNNGTVAGGGGGGGGAIGIAGDEYWYGGGGGGGGRSGLTNSAGGPQGPGFMGAGGASPGSAGTVNGPGGGGKSANINAYGGSGGGWGAGGGTGSSSHPSGPVYASNGPFSGGGGGAAVVGNSNITWVATGTRIGSIS